MNTIRSKSSFVRVDRSLLHIECTLFRKSYEGPFTPVHVFTPIRCHIYDATIAAFEAVFELRRQNMKGASVPRHRTWSQPQIRHDPGVNS